MIHQVFTRLALDSAGITGPISEVSQPVSMDGTNTAQVSGTIVSLTATNVAFQLQQSNDEENWTTLGSATNQVLGSFTIAASTGVSAAYARLKCTITGAGKAVLAATIQATQL